VFEWWVSNNDTTFMFVDVAIVVEIFLIAIVTIDPYQPIDF
jgi:hypothetical protein